HPARVQPPLPRIPLQSRRLLRRHPSARPSHPTSSRQRPHPQRSQFLQPPRTDPACRLAASRLQHRRPRRADLLPLLTPCSPATLTRHLARLRQLGVIKRVTGTYRYYLTRAGRAAIAAGRRLTEHTIIPALANKLCSLFANTQLVSDYIPMQHG